MRSIFLISGLFLFFHASFGQDAKLILKQSYDTCQSVQNGYYEMTKYKKYMSYRDTSKSSFHCHFKKLEVDSLYSSAFHYKAFRNNKYTGDILFTGEDFVRTGVNDSTATIMSKSLWAKEIKSYSHNYTFYSPLVNKTSWPLQHDSDFVDDKHIFKFIGEEVFNGINCYHLQVNEIPKINSIEKKKVVRQEYHYWINKDDFIPVKYSMALDIVMDKTPLYQYELCVLNKYEVNSLKDESILTLNSIPTYYRLVDFVPYKSPDPLPLNSRAPEWELFSLADEKISLNSMKGNLVLVNFFYKACYPCIQALPITQALSDKYKDRGLRVIGIDATDKKDDDMAVFLSKQGITYKVLFGGKEVSMDYHISGSPTMFLIDRSGKIIFIQVGYGKDVDAILENIIKKNL